MNTEPRYTCTNWDEPVVIAKKRGVKRADLEFKVKSTGVHTMRCNKTLNDALRFVRMGYDVHLLTDQGPALRLYSCARTDGKSMFVCAQTMGKFRNSLSDKKLKIVYRGKVVDGEALAAEARKRHEEYAAERIEVSPDTIVICPECGTEIRVGRSLRG